MREPGRASNANGIPGDRWRELLVCLALVVVNASIYWQVSSHQFIDLDDDVYVSKNPMVQAGLSLTGVQWAFTTFHAANWHPLTWLSHMLDVQIFGLQPGGAHLTNLWLHMLSSVLAFLMFRRTTGALWRSAMVAALFAVHPLHVESVAWLAERKDVLSTVFWLLTMWAYVRSTQTAAKRRWPARVFLFMALGLMAKPMLVTVPFVLLLMDYWPLGRLRWKSSDGFGRLLPSALPLVKEKLPLFVLSMASGVVTFIAQQSGGAVQQLQNVPLSYRLPNAAIACASYLVSLFWPRNLAVYYPFPPAGHPLWLGLAALLLLAGVSAFVWRFAGGASYLVAGWLWYLGTLVPVIGLIQVGGQAMADRYTYVPYFGVFVMIVWGASDLLARFRVQRPAVTGLVLTVLIVLSLLSWRQVWLWRDSTTLFEHALSVTRDNAVIEYDLGIALGQQGRSGEAAAHFAEAVRVWPEFNDALFNMGVALAAQGRLDEALSYYARALKVRPDSAKVQLNIGSTLAQQGKLDESLPYLNEALRLEPDSAQAHTNVGLILLRQGRAQEALSHLQRAVQLDPHSPEAENNLGLALLVEGKGRDAEEHFSSALRLNPGYAAARDNLRRAQKTFAAPPDQGH